MGYALHTNNDVRDQLRAGHIPTKDPILLGSFREAEYGKQFEYAERRWPDDTTEPSLCHIVYVGDSQPRLAKVLQTVAYVLVDSGEIQKWTIRSHRHYPTDWVKA